MKIAKDNDQRIRILRFGFCDVDGKQQIDVLEKVTTESLSGSDAFAYLRDKILKEDQCTYVLYDCHYESNDTGTKKELVFIMWCPTNAKLGQKLYHASSKEALKRKMQGVKFNLELTEIADISSKKVFAEALGKSDEIVSIEGEPIK